MTDTQKLDLLLENSIWLKENVTQLKGDVTQLKGDVTQLKEDVTQLKGDVTQLKEDVTQLRENVTRLEEETAHMKKDISCLQENVAKINTRMECEISHYIRIVAEGHIDLNRKLDQCITLSSEVKAKQEMQDIFITRHENKLKAM